MNPPCECPYSQKSYPAASALLKLPIARRTSGAAFRGRYILVVALCVPIAIVQAQQNTFHLRADGQDIGSASYVQDASRLPHTISADFSYSVGTTTVKLHRDARFDAGYEELGEKVSGTVADQPVTYTITTDDKRTQLNFDATVGSQTPHFDFDLNPHTVVFANFDPSAIQVLLDMMRTAPPQNGKLWAFAPIGHGAMIPTAFDAAADTAAIRDSKPVTAKHSTLTIAGNTMDIYADSDGNLLLAEIVAQDVHYVRNGFGLAKPAVAPGPPAGVTEREITFPTDGLTAPGTLTLPAGATSAHRVPIAVLVQGSGVQDRNETVGANKEFQQLAWGLAQRGIATIRYDRRPLFNLASFTSHQDLDHEVVIDAASALAFAASVPEADPQQVFLIGHSLGAQLAPYIVARRNAEKPGSVRGEVLLAGIALPIDQTIQRQIREMGAKQGGTPEQLQPILDSWQKTFTDARDPKITDDTTVGPDNVKVQARYWRDWMARDAVKEMKAHPLPTLVLRGANDANVTHEDFTLLAAAAPAPCSKSQELPGLNHLFMKQEDELAAGTIAPEVLDAIAGWLKATATCK